jgi:hypothetical protein
VIKVINSINYHLWTDALHGRALARQTRNDWDRGTYVRWTIQSAWTAFETVCGEVLNAPGLGMRFKDGLNQALANKGLPTVTWGSGVWQKILQVYDTRKEFTHVQPTVAHTRLMPPTEEADTAIDVLRTGIKEICRMASVPDPLWVDDDTDRGWDVGAGLMADVKHIRAGVKEDDPDVVKIAYVHRGKEYICDISPPGTAHGPLLDELERKLNIPVSAIRAYRGSTVVEERLVRARGG